MRELNTEIEINSGPKPIWDTLMDFESYPDWNPFITSIKGNASKGYQLKITISPPNSKPMNFTPKVLAAKGSMEFRWLGRLGLPGIFDGEHIFEIIDLGGGSCRFIQREKFRGILVPFLWKQLNTNTRLGFEMMNEALKKRIESTND